jgi:hypothetical protein
MVRTTGEDDCDVKDDDIKDNGKDGKDNRQERQRQKGR